MVLLVVDAQNGIVDERLYEFRKFVGNIKKLIGAAREQGIEVIYVQHDDGPGTGFSIGDDEFEVYSEFKPMPDEKRFIKSVCSSFKKESGLLEYLTAKEAEKDLKTTPGSDCALNPLAIDEPLEYVRLYLDGILLDVSVSQSVYIRTFYRFLI